MVKWAAAAGVTLMLAFGAFALSRRPSAPSSPATAEEMPGTRAESAATRAGAAATTAGVARPGSRSIPPPKFVREGSMSATKLPPVPSWPAPTPPEFIAKIENERAARLAEFEKAAEITPAQKARLTVVISQMNADVGKVFEKYAAEPLRNGDPSIPDDVRDKYLVETGEVYQKAAQEIAQLAPKGVGKNSEPFPGMFLAAQMIDPENQHKTASFMAKYVAGGPYDPEGKLRPEAWKKQ